MKSILYKLFLISTLTIVVLALAIKHPAGNIIYLRLALLIALMVEGIALYKILFVDRKVSKLLSGVGSILISSYVFLVILEAAFMFIPKSHGAGYALSARLWLERYQKPINSYGYRDTEPQDNGSVVLFVGDSFTEGQGIKSIDGRFSNIVGSKLSSKDKSVTAINIGKRGYDSAKEFAAMNKFINKSGITPKTIVLQYFGNDIDETAFAHGIGFNASKAYSNVPLPLEPFVKGSYFLNFFYWLFPQGDAEPYREFLNKAYKSEDVFSKHLQDLQQFVDYANNHSIRLVVVVFPFLWDTDGSSNELYVNELIDFFNARNIEVVDIYPLLKDIPVMERMINANDGHASVVVNEKVAEEILTYFN